MSIGVKVSIDALRYVASATVSFIWGTSTIKKWGESTTQNWG